MSRPYKKKMSRDWREVEEKIDYLFRNRNLLRQAFIHPSYLANYINPHQESYERLEFLGDKVVALVVSNKIYREYWQKSEGELTNIMGMIASNKTLGKVAGKLWLGEYLFLSHGEEKAGGRTNPNILADVFEALIGAIFLDGGWRAAEKVLEKCLLEEIPTLVSRPEEEYDPKSKLQKLAQEKFQITPHFEVLKVYLKTGRSRYAVGAYLDDVLIGEAEGDNKHKASVGAAFDALIKTRELTKVPLALLKKRDVIKEILY